MPQLNIYELLARAPVILMALTFHECAHAYAAYRCGDPTAKHMGRLTLNPLKHLDLIGTICLFLAPIGWAKPVPVNPYNYRRPREDDIIVSIAGVATNFAQALIFLFLAMLIVPHLPFPTFEGKPAPADFLMAVLFLGILINMGLGIFNLIPLFPLDGSHVLSNMLPYEQARKFDEFNKYAPFVLLALVFFGGNIIGTIVGIPTRFIMNMALSSDNVEKMRWAISSLYQ